jgi:hypothetical protein
MDNNGALGPRPEYGGTARNFQAIVALKDAYRFYVADNQNLKMHHREKEHNHAMEMVLTKIGRIATGEVKLDNYIDAIGYLQIAANLVGLELEINVNVD